GGGSVSVVGHHRDALLEGVGDGGVEGGGIDYRGGDPVYPGADRGVDVIHHGGHVGARRPRPLVAHLEQGAGVREGVGGGNEEWVGGDMVDEGEIPVGMLGKVSP